ncbi:asparaginase [Umezawaea tangerina]|uniref:Asparaginase n=1 Tax=Umezawaea tangerina TaxID=84725 RepID=A0A2T0SSP6_9PSEU|nr:asparaginase [Umezawaea tangerina]
MHDPLAEVTRSGFVESRHFGSVVGLDPSGAVALRRGPVDDPVLPRSTAKPFQALACLAAGAPLEGPALAVAAGSHTGLDRHVEVVSRVLADAGLTPDALRCVESWPEDEPTRDDLIRAGEKPSRIRMNCSGKHAGMLAGCVASGWSVDDYLDPEHPFQVLVRAGLEALAGERSTHTAVDGCGAPLFAVSLVGLARAVRGLVHTPVADAMRAHPEFVGGPGHVNTEVMRLLPGVVAKGGAEGVLVLATAEGHAVAVKVIDGGLRATTAIGLAALRSLGFDVTAAAAHLSVPVLGGGREVGRIVPV